LSPLPSWLGATIARLQNQIEALNAGLEKVSAQLELSESAPQTVLNSRKAAKREQSVYRGSNQFVAASGQ